MVEVRYWNIANARYEHEFTLGHQGEVRQVPGKDDIIDAAVMYRDQQEFGLADPLIRPLKPGDKRFWRVEKVIWHGTEWVDLLCATVSLTGFTAKHIIPEGTGKLPMNYIKMCNCGTVGVIPHPEQCPNS